MSELWTKDRVLSLAPDAASAKAGQSQAGPGKWPTLGRTQTCVWGEVSGSGQKPYQVCVDLSEPAFKCSCPSRKFPCKHALGLLLILAEQAAKFPDGEPPDWVAAWLAGREKRSEQREKKASQPAKPVDAAAQAKRVEKREANIQAGLDELSRVLIDCLRQGLAAIQSQPVRYWGDVAARLVDAQAPGLARLVNELGETVSAGSGWQSRFLRRVARLHLAVQGYRRAAELPMESQQDLRTLIGWTQSKEEVLEQPGVEGPWCVVAQQIEEEERLTVQRTWLLRSADGMPALLLDFSAMGQPLDASLVVGATVHAELAYYPSAEPLRAVIKNRTRGIENFAQLPGVPSIDQALDAYAQGLAKNPWLERRPMSLAAVTPVPSPVASHESVTWHVIDGDGKQAPLHARFNDGWTLLALSGGGPISLFGEWDGEQLRPLGVFAKGSYFAWPKRSTGGPLARVS
ncbi:MAG: SWIM zinc finger family protein [Planctomycetaceae bacterium]|nr:SWIM zinc finger family protein [Planctomycetaceae bacterium]